MKLPKQDRQGVRTVHGLERKYRFQRQFTEVSNAAEKAQETASGAEEYYDGIKAAGWEFGNVTLKQDTQIFYQGAALFSKEIDTGDGKTSAVALTPTNLYLFGKTSAGVPWVSETPWSKIVAAANK